MMKLFSFAESFLLWHLGYELDMPQRPPKWSK